MFFPLYILYTDNTQSSQAYRNKKTMENEGKEGANIEKKHTHRQTDIFGKVGIKVTRSIICDLILILFLFSVPLIGSDCPSQSRDAILVAMETSSASAGQRCCCIFSRRPSVGAALDERQRTSRGTLSNTSVIAGVPDSDLIECLS